MSIGIWQIVLILIIVLIIFGAGKLPKVMGDVGKGIKSMKDGMSAEEEKPKAKPKTKRKTTAKKKPAAKKKTTRKTPAKKKTKK